jgi:transposase InsO family protein
MARVKLRELQQEHPDWSHGEMAEAVGYSVSWVRKWRKRLAKAPPDNEQVLLGQSRANHMAPRLSEVVIRRILEIRDDPPDNLERKPGPKAILYYLHKKDEPLKAEGHYLPRSTRTIWKVLDQHHRIIRETPQEHTPWDFQPPLQAWHIDFKDVSMVPADPEGKKQHVVETLNIVDAGTSILIDNPSRDDFNEETALLAMAEVLQAQGRPYEITCDRDVRFVGSDSGSDFPSPFVRFLLSLDIIVNICPPMRPDLNPFVERYNGTYKRECLYVHRPADLEQTQEVSANFKYHYNFERPNQAVTCGNQPPRAAYPDLPSLPPIPAVVDPDKWLDSLHGTRFTRKVRADGTVTIDNVRYYIQQKLRGQRVVLVIDAIDRQFRVLHDGREIKRVPIKHLYNGQMLFHDYLNMMLKEAVSQQRRRRGKVSRGCKQLQGVTMMVNRCM